MALTYDILLPCEPRLTVGSEDLANMVVARAMALSVREKYEQADEALSPEKMEFEHTKRSSTGNVDKETHTVAELEQETAALPAFEHFCDGCPAALGDQSYGCVRQLTFPISEEAERWLLNRIAPGDTVAGTFFRQMVTQLDLGKSEQLMNWRRENLLGRAESLTSGNPLVDSNQVLDMLFLSGALTPSQSLAALLSLGALSTERGHTPDEMIAMIQAIQSQSVEEQAVPAFVFQLSDEEKDDSSIREIKTFLFALFTAFSLQVPVNLRTI